MSRDRLAAFRSQQQQRSSPTNQPTTLNTDNYELRNVNAGNDEMTAFYSNLQVIQNDLDAYRDYVSRISELHSRSMNVTDSEGIEQDRIQLNDLLNKSRTLSNDIKKKIEGLQKEKHTGTEGRIRAQQLLAEIKPDATPEEIKTVVEESGGEQIFADALQSTTRYGVARVAYQEVQERQADIKKIEYTLGELAQLFNDMSILIDQQNEVVDEIEQRAGTVAIDSEQGLKQTERAVKSARSARRKRWICFFLTLIILAVLGIALGIGLGVGIPKHNS
ncbi:hypothetical protein Clacol_006312 [Clathrus columnatus]|uniref:t-SNARE coiled-coil homology domain-containing protein n=1 Tax=Clathrus columnatus TaxID=1419009 RepID=A0AAV5AGH9_9AGAM|nr:hypothetical protein Clacol_006312 [Clathrus columnatus]